MRRALSRDKVAKAKAPARAKRPFHVTAGADKDALPGTNIDRQLTMYERSVEAMNRKVQARKDKAAREEAKVRAGLHVTCRARRTMATRGCGFWQWNE